MTINNCIMTKKTSLNGSWLDFNPDDFNQPVVALHLEVHQHNDIEQPIHTHLKGQLLIAMKGGIFCKIENSIWLAIPQHAIWIPSGLPHSNQATENAELYYLFIDPNKINLPNKCCTIKLNSLLREMIKYLATQEQNYLPKSSNARLSEVLLEQLAKAPAQEFCLPISDHPIINTLSDLLIKDTANRATLEQWANYFNTTERTLGRLIRKETGMTFGQWRQQLYIIIALNQLSEGNNVQSISGNLGYDSANAFITMFKKNLGCTPTQYFSKLEA